MRAPEVMIDLPARDDVERILVLKWSAMGDVVMATALFEDIHRAFPGRVLDLNTLPAWAGLLRGDPRFHRVFAPEVRGAPTARRRP